MTPMGIVAEGAGETRVAATPATTAKLIALGYDVCVEAGAGAASSFPDAAYRDAGARIVSRAEAWAAEVVLKVNPPTPDEVALLADGRVAARGRHRELMDGHDAASQAYRAVVSRSVESSAPSLSSGRTTIRAARSR